MIKDKRILITGINGFIGNHLYNYVKPHNEIVELDKEDGGLWNKPLVIDKVKGVDYIFHLGAVSTVPDCEKDQWLANLVNVIGTWNLLRAAHEAKVKKVVFVSSAAVYDIKSFYALTKSIGEKYCHFFTQRGLPCVILRLFNVYGLGNNQSAVIPSFIRQLKQGDEVVIQGDGKQTRDFVYIDDVVKAMAQSMEEVNPNIYNIGTGVESSIKLVACMIGDIMGKAPVLKFTDSRENDIERSRAIIPEWFKPQYTLEEGLKKIIGV